jgi:BirA family biotin operon repressor/biotin-[acetyl-CoA-carboxylase] ligase
MCRRIAAWDRGRGFAGIRDDWLAVATGIGADITVRNDDSEKHGRFVGLDQFGRLLLELHNGDIEKVSAGDVFPFALSADRSVQSPPG